MNLGNKTILVWDYGTFIHLAKTLSETFGRTLLYTASEYADSPSSNRARIGAGIEGVELISPLLPGKNQGKSFWDFVPEVDLFVFPGVGHADVQDELKRQGKRVWGSGRAGELELFRAPAKEQMEEHGLPVQPVETITGLDNLTKLLEGSKETLYVKISGLRGDQESFKHPGDFRVTEPILDKLKYKYGRVACDKMQFQVENELPKCIEAGSDQYFIHAQCCPEVFVGLERKDQVYVVTHAPLNSLAEPIRKPLRVMSEILKGKDVATWNSTEVRIPEDNPKIGYPLEWTMRGGAPPLEVQIEMGDNWPEVCWYGAEGILVPLNFTTEVGMTAIIDTDMGETQSKTIVVPKEEEQWVKLRRYCVEDGAYNLLPEHGGLTAVGAVVATGKDVISTAKLLAERCDKLSSMNIGLQIFVDQIPKAVADLRKGEEMGIDFGSVSLPTPEEVSKAIDE